MTSSISILHFLLNNWSRLIACNLKANIHRGVISNTCAHENHWKVAKYSNVKTSTNLWKWRNKAVGMHIAGCSQQDVVQQFNVHPSTINQLLSHFRVTRQVNARRRRRRQLKTAVRQDRCIVITSRCNRLVSACKVANVTSDVWIEENWPECKKQVATGCQYTRAKTSCCSTFDSTSSSNACCLGNHPSTLVFNFI
jgi:transposase